MTRALYNDETPPWKRVTRRLDEIEAADRAAHKRKIEAAIVLGMACFAVLFSLFALVMSIRVLP